MSSWMAGRSASLAREVCYNGGFLREPPAKSADQGGSRQQCSGCLWQAGSSAQQSGSSIRGGSSGEQGRCCLATTQ